MSKYASEEWSLEKLYWRVAGYPKEGGNSERPMIISVSPNGYDRCETMFISINGTPPKGYALYVPFERILVLIKSDFSRKMVYRGVKIPTLDLLADSPGEYVWKLGWKNILRWKENWEVDAE